MKLSSQNRLRVHIVGKWFLLGIFSLSPKPSQAERALAWPQKGPETQSAPNLQNFLESTHYIRSKTTPLLTNDNQVGQTKHHYSLTGESYKESHHFINGATYTRQLFDHSPKQKTIIQNWWPTPLVKKHPELNIQDPILRQKDQTEGNKEEFERHLTLDFKHQGAHYEYKAIQKGEGLDARIQSHLTGGKPHENIKWEAHTRGISGSEAIHFHVNQKNGVKGEGVALALGSAQARIHFQGQVDKENIKILHDPASNIKEISILKEQEWTPLIQEKANSKNLKKLSPFLSTDRNDLWIQKKH